MLMKSWPLSLQPSAWISRGCSWHVPSGKFRFHRLLRPNFQISLLCVNFESENTKRATQLCFHKIPESTSIHSCQSSTMVAPMAYKSSLWIDPTYLPRLPANSGSLLLECDLQTLQRFSCSEIHIYHWRGWGGGNCCLHQIGLYNITVLFLYELGLCSLYIC